MFINVEYPVLGGWGEWQDADGEIQEICNDIRNAVEEEMGRDGFSKFTAVSYMSQVVSGTNYKIKLDVGEEYYLEIFVYKHWSNELTLNTAEFGKVTLS